MSSDLCQILGLEVAGQARASSRDLSLSLAILSELLVASDACQAARRQGKLASYRSDAGVYLVFKEQGESPLHCALDLSEMIRDLPLMSVQMVLHYGEVEVEPGSDGRPVAVGEGIEEIEELFESAEPGEIFMSESFAATLSGSGATAGQLLVGSAAKPPRTDPKRLAMLGCFGLEADGAAKRVTDVLSEAFAEDGHSVWRDSTETPGTDWAKSVEEQIRDADAVIAVVSRASVRSELLQFELDLVVEERRKRGRPHILPVWLENPESVDFIPVALSQSLYQAVWVGESHTGRVIEEVRATIAGGQAVCDADRLDTTGRAVSQGSAYYVHRDADEAFEAAIRNRESIILVRGPRQIGKTTLLGRGIELVDTLGWRCAATDFQVLGSRQLESEHAFYRVLVSTLCHQVGFDYDFDSEWLDSLSPILNMDGFMRDLLENSDQPLVWFMDEADRLFTSHLATDFFALVRSWHNARATDPMGPWSRLVIAIGYAADAHLFIRDLNKSPFNVGRRIEMPMLTEENVRDLNVRYGTPLHNGQVRALFNLVGGQPFLTRRAFDLLTDGTTIESLLANADQDGGPFGDHLRRILLSVSQFPTVWQALVESLTSPNFTDTDGLYRLVAANVLVRKASGKYELPIELYRRYLERYAIPEAA